MVRGLLFYGVEGYKTLQAGSCSLHNTSLYIYSEYSMLDWEVADRTGRLSLTDS